MAERADVTVDWGLSPRLIEVALPSVELSNQDMHDTLNSNTLPAGMADDSLENLDDDPIIDSAGKEDLGGGVEVGITSTLLDGQIAFGRTAPRAATSTITTANAAGTLLIDTTALFVTNLVRRGDWVINYDDRSVTEVLAVLSETQLRTRIPSGGIADDFGVGDNYRVWAVEEAELSGGNVVAVDTVPVAINPLFTTFGRFATRASASSATTANQDALNFSTYQNRVTFDPTNTSGLAATGTVFPAATRQQPSLTLADAQTVAVANGFTSIRVLGSATFGATDNVDGYDIEGDGPNLSVLTFVAGVSTVRSIVMRAEVTGDLAGAIELDDCHLNSLVDIGGTVAETIIKNSLLEPGTAIKMTAGATQRVHIIDCVSGSPAGTAVIIDWNGTGPDTTIHKYSGGINMINVTNAQDISYDGDSHITIAASCTNGHLVVRGDVKITDSSGAGFTVSDEGTYEKLRDLWARLGLDPTLPMTTNDDNSITVGGITIGAVNGPTSTTQTRTGTL